MATFPTQARAVVIGGGIVGCSTAYHLGKLGWKDTVLVWPGESVRLAIDFKHPHAGAQTFMFHCHNLEHEDKGMMVNFRVA